MRTILGTRGIDLIDETAASDDLQIFGFAGDDRISSGSGNDELIGGKGHDTLSGGDGDDTLWGGNGPVEDLYNPDYGNDILRGGWGNDHLFGQNGSDTLEGGIGDDELNGGRGDDNLTGGRGTDKMWGDEGKDRFIFNPNTFDKNLEVLRDSTLDQQTMDQIFDFVSSQDQIAFSGMASAVQGVNYDEIDMFPGASYADVLRTGSAIIASGKTYAFVADGHDGYLFADMNLDGAVDLGIKLVSLYNKDMFAASDLIGL